MRRLLLTSLALASAACQPAFERRPSQVDRARVLAVRAIPAENKPGVLVTIEALLADPSGPVTAPAPGWAFCIRPRPAADYNSVSAQCLDPEAPWLLPFFSGADPLKATALLPTVGCAVFGSEPLPPAPGEPAVRPADPDLTGGYYQPVRVSWPGGGPVGFGQLRLQCALPQASAGISQAFRDRYLPNQNPSLLTLQLSDGATAIAPGASVTLVAQWAGSDAEPYVRYDQKTAALVDEVEVLRIAWFGTSGQLATDSSLSTGDSAQTGWLAPAEPGLHHLWAVLRDDRGGMSWRHLSVEVR